MKKMIYMTMFLMLMAAVPAMAQTTAPDADRDGVADDKDKCANTPPADRPVAKNGCGPNQISNTTIQVRGLLGDSVDGMRKLLVELLSHEKNESMHSGGGGGFAGLEYSKGVTNTIEIAGLTSFDGNGNSQSQGLVEFCRRDANKYLIICASMGNRSTDNLLVGGERYPNRLQPEFGLRGGLNIDLRKKYGFEFMFGPEIFATPDKVTPGIFAESSETIRIGRDFDFVFGGEFDSRFPESVEPSYKGKGFIGLGILDVLEVGPYVQGLSGPWAMNDNGRANRTSAGGEVRVRPNGKKPGPEIHVFCGADPDRNSALYNYECGAGIRFSW